MSHKTVFCFCAAALLVCGFAWAQYQVNPQINMGGSGGGGGGSVRYPASYANQVSQSPGQNPGQNPMLQSQVRYTNVQSGNLQSQIRATNVAAGPLAGQQVPVPQDAASFAARKDVPLPPAQSPTPPASVRYSSQAPSSNAVNTQIGGRVESRIDSQVSGSVRYGG